MPSKSMSNDNLEPDKKPFWQEHKLLVTTGIFGAGMLASLASKRGGIKSVMEVAGKARSFKAAVDNVLTAPKRYTLLKESDISSYEVQGIRMNSLNPSRPHVIRSRYGDFSTSAETMRPGEVADIIAQAKQSLARFTQLDGIDFFADYQSNHHDSQDVVVGRYTGTNQYYLRISANHLHQQPSPLTDKELQQVFNFNLKKATIGLERRYDVFNSLFDTGLQAGVIYGALSLASGIPGVLCYSAVLLAGRKAIMTFIQQEQSAILDKVTITDASTAELKAKLKHAKIKAQELPYDVGSTVSVKRDLSIDPRSWMSFFAGQSLSLCKERQPFRVVKDFNQALVARAPEDEQENTQQHLAESTETAVAPK